MSPNDIDPSLRTGEPLLESLDDGFSPPARASEQPPASRADAPEPAQRPLGPQSPF